MTDADAASYRPSELIEQDIDQYLLRHQNKSLLRFITCGSVDDGKSTLIGRLLYDAKTIYDDQLSALREDSRRVGTQGGAIDFALLLDGLAAEREQGITIDVAYRFFSTDRRKFIVADTPGHEQYTRNMVTGASTAELAIILVDARKGMLTQTRRHTYLVSLMGIRRLVLAVNKMDLIGYDEARFDEICREYAAFARNLGVAEVAFMPISALDGDNIAKTSERTPWYRGPALMDHLEMVDLDAERMARGPFRMPVQWVNRPNLDFRGFSGLVAGGGVRVGDQVKVLPSERTSAVRAITIGDDATAEAVAGQSVTLTLVDEIDCSRGDVIAAADETPEIADQFEAALVWMADAPMLAGRSYLIKLAAQQVTATITSIKYRVDVNSLEHHSARQLALNEIGVCNLSLDRPLVFEPFTTSQDLGGFILIDRQSNATLAAGMIHFGLRRAHNIPWQELEIDGAARALAMHQHPKVIWFTGLSGAGKSTVANLVERRLHALGRNTYLLDGDNIRHGLCRDLGFTDADRVENIRRTVEVARLMADAGLIVLVSLISPFRAERLAARERIGANVFVEVHIDTPLAVAEARDAKGLYRKARTGELKNFTGIDSPYEPPEAPDVYLDGTDPPAELAQRVIEVVFGAA